MFGSDEIDVVAANLLELQHHLGKGFRVYFHPSTGLADVVILAEDTSQIAHGKENSSAAADASETVFFSEVGEVAANQGISPGFADGSLVRQPIDGTITRADPAVSQTGNGCFYPFLELPASKKGHIRRLITMAGEKKAVICS